MFNEGDHVSIKVENLANQPTTLHMHGMHQNGTFYMDGVSGITQCTILEGESFEYNFIATPAGTHWYHSHTGDQPLDGLAGAMIVKDSPWNYPSGSLYQYDEELLIVINDWYHFDSEMFVSADITDESVSALINGLGQGNPIIGYNTTSFSTLNVSLLFKMK